MSQLRQRRVGFEEDGRTPRILRVMTPEEVEERAELNRRNTAQAIRRRAVEEASKRNGR